MALHTRAFEYSTFEIRSMTRFAELGVGYEVTAMQQSEFEYFSMRGKRLLRSS